MKKIIFCISLVIIYVIIFCLTHLSNTETKQYNLTSQIQHNYYILKTDKYSAELSCGLREDDFECDGISNEKIEYGILEVYINGFTDYADKIDVILNINGKNYAYILEKNPFKNSFVCDIGFIIKYDNDINFKINSIDDKFFKFECVSNTWKVNYKDAQKKGFNILKSFIKQNSKNKKTCECYLTAIYNDLENSKYFWLFQVQTSKLTSKIVVIDVNTCEIVLKS